MSNPELLIRRYVRFRNGDDEAWSDIIAQVTSYNKDGTFTVSPDKTSESQMKLTASQVKVYSPERFSDRYPNAPVIPGRPGMSIIPVGCVIDFSATDPNTPKGRYIITIDGSNRIVGRSVAEAPGNVNTVDNNVQVSAAEGDLVEFENVCFDGSKWDLTFLSVKGEVVFRSCTFTNRKSCANFFGDGEPERARVTFENCVFRNIVSCAVSVSYAFAHFTNCRFDTCGIGVVVEEGGYIDVRGSTFRCSTGGVNAPHLGEVVLNNCLFIGMLDYGVLVSENSTLHSVDCSANNCTGSGVVIEGRLALDALLKIWFFQDCHIGVRVSNGNVNVSMEFLNIQGCKIGIYIAPDVTGEILMWGMNEENIVDLSGAKCSIYLRKDQDTMRAPQLERLHASRELLAAHGIKYGYPVSARTRKVLAEAGIMDMVCSMCKAVAPTGNVYKKCARCSEARYCSRACQETHWPVHSIQCRVFYERAETVAARGFVGCDKCGKVESHTSGALHNACSRCLQSFYCSKECQRADWSEHKKECTEYQKR